MINVPDYAALSIDQTVIGAPTIDSHAQIRLRFIKSLQGRFEFVENLQNVPVQMFDDFDGLVEEAMLFGHDNFVAVERADTDPSAPGAKIEPDDIGRLQLFL